MEEYKPREKTIILLDRAMEHIESVSYRVSLRWLFYRLLQDGFYSKKSDYDSLCALTARIRRMEYGGWHPLTLADETREMEHPDHVVVRDRAPVDTEDELNDLIDREIEATIWEKEDLEQRLENFECTFEYGIDPNYLQAYFSVIMFEARAMTQQFKQYTRGFTLIPLGGQPSIPFKYNIAQFIEARALDTYDLPAQVLYFGDLDPAGQLIFETAERDINLWSNLSIDFIWCGLTQDQVTQFGVPENPDIPGHYQWEALTDEQASQIISGALNQYTDETALERAGVESLDIRRKVREAVNERLDL